MSLSEPCTKTKMAKWAGGLVLLTALLTPDRVHAQQRPDETDRAAASDRAAESEQLALKGFEAYKAGEYETALEYYDQALEAHAAAALHYNVARIYDTKLSEYEKAIESYKKALEAPDVTEALADKSIARIRVLTALLEQSKEPEEQAPPAQRQPPQDESESRAASKEERATPRRSTQKTIGYVVGFTGLVAAGAGLGLGGWAMLERDEARKDCDGNQCETRGGADSMNTAHDLATASTITVVAGGALAVVGFGMVLFAPRNQPADRDSAKAPLATGRTGLELAITPTSGGAALQLAGAF